MNINLTNIGQGAAVELFQAELEKVIENILDPDTDTKAKREITLKVSVLPSKHRRFGEVQISATSKLAPPIGFETRAFFGREGDKFVACEDDPKQVTIDEFMKKPENVETLEQPKTLKEGASQ